MGLGPQGEANPARCDILVSTLASATPYLQGLMVATPDPSAVERQASSNPIIRLAWYRDWVLLLAVSGVLAVDQLTKYLVRTNMRLGESWPSEGLFRLTHGTNSGSAFGLFPNQTVLLAVASVVAIGFLVYFYRAHAMPRALLRFAIGLQLGGALGNLIDRLRTGAVVDFIDVGAWPIFNLADSSIVVGMALLVGILLLGDAGSKTMAEPEDGSGDSDGP